MSYEIVYSRNFIKTTRGIIPLILTGSNNCHERHGNRWRRERDWSQFWGNKHVEMDAQDLLTFMADYGADKDNYDFCDFRGKRLYKKDAYNFYKQGIKNAHTIEEYIQNGRQKNWHIGSYLRAYIHDWSNGYGKSFIALDKHVSTTAELEAWIDDAKAYIHERNNIYMRFTWDTCEPITYNEPKDIKGKVIIAYKKAKGVYLSDKQKLTHNKCEAKVFDNQDNAKAFCQNNGYSQYYYKIIKYNANEKNKKHYVISLGHGAYFYRKTNYGMRYIYSKSDAQKMDMKRATTLLERLIDAFKDKGYTFTIEEA